MSKQSTSELDQIVNIYRTKLLQVNSLWTELIQQGYHCDSSWTKTTHDLAQQLETTAMHLLEEQVVVETARCHVRRLKQMLDVSRHIVDAKSNHLKMEEEQVDKERRLKYKEFQKIHRIEEEKDAIETNLLTARDRIAVLMDALSNKCVKQKYTEEFSECLTEELSKDLQDLKAQTEKAREERSVWDRFHVDVLEELNGIIVDKDEMMNLQTTVTELTQSIQNQNKWYDEELRTKLFCSSRNKEIQNKIANLKTVIKRMERSGHPFDVTQKHQDKALNDFSSTVIIDGVPDIQAKDVEEFLSHQFGVRVLADYSMLRRLKDEIGMLGLAYLVERIRFQNHAPKSSRAGAHRTYTDLEENDIELALETIAKEYRAHEDVRGHSGMPSHLRTPKDDVNSGNGLPCGLDTPQFVTAARQRPDTCDGAQTSPGHWTPTTGSGATVDTATCSNSLSSNKSSNVSLKSKSSTSRFKRMFKF